jgi:hypothetical protein
MDNLYLPIELFGIIYSYADHVDVLQFQKCQTNINFWIVLVNNRFSEYMRPSIVIKDFQDLYFGLCMYGCINYSYQFDFTLLESLYNYSLESTALAVPFIVATRTISAEHLLSIKESTYSQETLKYLLRIKCINRLDNVTLLKIILLTDEPDIFDMYKSKIFGNKTYQNIYDEVNIKYLQHNLKCHLSHLKS